MSQRSQAQKGSRCPVPCGGPVWGAQGLPQSWGGSKGHGRLMHSLRLRGQGTAWSEMVPGLGLRLGSPAHTPHPLTPPHGPSLSTTRAHPRVQTSKNPASVLPPMLSPIPASDVGQTQGFCPVCTETGPYCNCLMSPEEFAI